MRILYVITKSNWGGAQKHVYDLATGMKERGHEVWVALGGNGTLKKRLEDSGIYTFSISRLGRDVSVANDTASFRSIFSIIKNKRPDILHLHSPKASGLGALAGRLLRVRSIISTVHGWTFNENRPIHERLSIAFVSWMTMILCHTTIVLSEREYSQASYFPWVKDKLKLIPPGVKSPTLMSIEGAKLVLAKSLNMPLQELSKKTVIGVIAELHPNKGITFLLDAMKDVVRQVDNAILVILGDGQDRAMLETKIKDLGIEKSAFLLGYVENAYEYLKSFAIFVLPSIKEGLPYVILEAGHASLPVVATTVGGVPEAIEDMKSGILVQPKNSHELAHAIMFLLDHPNERKKYGIALKERTTSRFSLEKMLWLVEGLYKER